MSKRRYSTAARMGAFIPARRLTEGDEVVNRYQKPVALFAKHLKMACKTGDVVVDVTAGTGTTAVS